MSRRVRLDPDAQGELDAAVAWYDAESRRPTLGDQLLEEVDHAIARVAERPGSFTLDPGVSGQLGVRRCPVRRFPYVLLFIELAEEIRIIAIAHRRRRPGYWRGRLSGR